MMLWSEEAISRGGVCAKCVISNPRIIRRREEEASKRWPDGKAVSISGYKEGEEGASDDGRGKSRRCDF